MANFNIRKFLLLILLAFQFITARAAWQPFIFGTGLSVSFTTDGDENFMLIGVTAAGLWRSYDGGLNWEPINVNVLGNLSISGPYLGIEEIDFKNETGDSIIITCKQVVDGVYNNTTCYVTTDYGDSWWSIQEGFAFGGADHELLIFSEIDNNVLYYINKHYFASSDNFGESWDVSVIDGIYYDKKQLCQDSTGVLYYASVYQYTPTGDEFGGLCRSVNNGEDWEKLLHLYDLWGIDYAFVDFFIQLSNGDWMVGLNYAYPVNWETMTLLRSTNNGETWERQGEGLPPRYMPRKIIEDPNIPGRLYIIGWQKYGLYTSDDYGVNWERCLNGLPENNSVCGDLECNPVTGDIYVTVMEYGFYKSADNGQSWSTIQTPPTGARGNISVFESKIYLRDKSSRLWEINPETMDVDEIELPIFEDTLATLGAIAYQNEDTLVSSYYKRQISTAESYMQMTYSYDGGESWEFGEFLDFIQLYPFDYYIGENIVRFACASYSCDALMFTDNFGRTWNSLSLPNNEHLISIGMDDDAIYVAAENAVYKTNEDFTQLISLNYSGPPTGLIMSIIDDHLYVNSYIEIQTSRTYHYYEGEWEELGDSESFQYNLTIPRTEDTLFFAARFDRANVWISEDFGWTWNEIECLFPYSGQAYAFYDLKYDPFRERIWASTGAGLCYLEVEQLSVNQQEIEFFPIEIITINVHPNPFNPSTTIRFDLAQAGNVSLTVYDIAGREVMKLVDGFQTAGSHSVIFNGTDLASGIYFARLQAGEFTGVKKLLLLK